MDDSIEIVPFPLYHGTSGHYLLNFQVGCTPTPWPHRDAALGLLQDTWDALRAHGCEPTFDVEDVLAQRNEASHWQHGELIVTASRFTAAMYAQSGAHYGGELLTYCREALNKLAEIDPAGYQRLWSGTRSLACYLKGSDLLPVVVQFDGVRLSDLSPLGPSDDVLGLVSLVVETGLDQQINFRLSQGVGTVSALFSVETQDTTSGAPAFRLAPYER